MESTSAAQFDASAAFGVPGLERVRDDVWALGQPMPGEHLPASLLYLLRDSSGGFHVIDPGTDGDDNWGRLVDALASLDARPEEIRSVTVTHLHADHLGMATRIQHASGATLALHHAEAAALQTLAEHPPTREATAQQAREWGVPVERSAELVAVADAMPPVIVPAIDLLLSNGDRLDVPGFALDVVHTPGHTPGHLCLRDTGRGLLFSGDHLLPTVFSGLGLGGASTTNPLADYLQGLERISRPGGFEVLPGHGFRFMGVAERAAETAEHHLRRTAQVRAAVAADPSLSIWEIASKLTWTAGFDNLSGFQLWSALSQTALHREYVGGRR